MKYTPLSVEIRYSKITALYPHPQYRPQEQATAYAAAYPGECRQTDADPDTGCMEFEIRKGRFSFRLTAPYSEERRRVASEAAKKNSVNGMGRSVHKNLLRDIAQIKGFREMVESAARVELLGEEY